MYNLQEWISARGLPRKGVARRGFAFDFGPVDTTSKWLGTLPGVGIE